MKKSLIALLVVLALIVTVSVFSVSADSTDYSLDSGVCPHCDTSWSEITDAILFDGTTTTFSTAGDYHYYLTANATVSASLNASTGANVVIHLNGHSLNYTDTSNRPVALTSGGTLYFVDAADGGGSMTGIANSTSSTGGVIRITKGTVHTYNITLNGGKLKEGGAVYAEGASAHYNMHGGTITGGSAAYNTDANGGGGGVCVKTGSFTMNGGTIEQCSAVTSGGGVYVNAGTVTMNSGTIQNCSVSATSGNVGGGGVRLNSSSTFNMNGGTIQNCSSTRYGGGVLINSGTFNFGDNSTNSSDITTDCIIQNCSATGSGNMGGAIWSSGATSKIVMDTDAKIYKCSAPIGGAIALRQSMGGTNEIKGGIIEECEATTGGGGAIYLFDAGAHTGKLTMSGGTIKNCEAATTGGAVHLEGYNKTATNTFTLNGGTIEDCRAANKGGSIFGNYGTIKLQKGTVKDGYIWGTKYGGNICVDYATLEISGGTDLEDANKNYMLISGGHIRASETQEKTEANILAAGGMGGNINVRGTATLTMTGGVVKDGIAAYGPNIYIEGTSAKEIAISGGTISGGVAKNDGGSIRTNNTFAGTLTISGADTKITGGTTAGSGGNIAFTATSGTMNITGGTISDGTAANGNGGNLSLTAGTVTIKGATISGGNAANGGNLYLNNTVNVTLGAAADDEAGTEESRVTITGGTATAISNSTGFGGNIYNSKADLDLSHCTIEDGTAMHGYEVIETTEGDGEEATTTYSLAVYSGGGGNIYTTQGLEIPVGCVVSGGTANGAHGGNLYVDKVDITVKGEVTKGKTVAKNLSVTAADETKLTGTAGNGRGGNVYIVGSKLIVDGGSITGGLDSGNNASTHGGNVCVEAGGELELINNATISGGKAGGSGGNIANMGGTVNIEDHTISDGVAGNRGGNIYLENNSTTYLNGATIKNGAAKEGGNLYVRASAVVTDGTTEGTIDNVDFIGGTSTTDGGSAYIAGGTYTLSNCDFKNDEAVADSIGGDATNYGGNLCIAGGTITLDTCTFSKGNGDVRGGNVYVAAGTVTFKNVTLSNGTSANGGNIFNSQGTINLGTVDENEAPNSLVTIENGTATGGFGGNINNSYGTMTIYTVTYDEDGTTPVAGTVITGGTAVATDDVVGGGGNIYTRRELTFPDGYTLSGGTATSSYGGNLYIDGGAEVTLPANTTITKGTASRGGNVYINNGTLDITGGTVSSGITSGTQATHGGNVWLEASGNLTMSAGSITGGRAGNTGGNIANNGTVTVTGGTITDGNAGNRGGNIGTYAGSTTNLTDVDISGGEAGTTGGGNIYLHNGTVNVNAGTTISGGTASTGANVYITNGTFNLSGTIEGKDKDAEGNYTIAMTEGGNVYINGGAANLLSGAIVQNGVAANGGNVYLNNGTFTMEGGTVQNGVASAAGGNIYAAAGTVSITGGTIKDGEAATTGGNLHLAVAPAGENGIENCYFVGGEAVQKGGSVYVDAANVKFTNCNFGFEVVDGETIADGGHVTGLSSTSHGGGNIFNNGDNLQMTGCTIANGVAGTKKVDDTGAIVAPDTTSRGGNIFVNAKATFTDCTITDGECYSKNTAAAGHGGNIHYNGGTNAQLNIIGCTISGGYAYGRGGNIEINKSNAVVTIEGSTIEGGISETAGGGNIACGVACTVNVDSDSTISGGKASTGANVYMLNGTFNLSGTIEGKGKDAEGNNTVAMTEGSNIYIDGGTVNLKSGATVQNGVAANGGNVYLKSGTFTMEGGTVQNGVASAAGGNIYAAADGTLTITGGTIKDGEAATTGGNLHLAVAPTGDNGIENCTFAGGEAGTLGGSVYSGVADVKFTNCIFGQEIVDGMVVVNGGKANGNGGGNIYSNAANFQLINSVVNGGEAGTLGEDGTVTTTGRGGNIFLNNTATLTGCTITGGKSYCNNTSYNGGGNIHYNGGNTLDITDCTITGGYAYGNGGNIELNKTSGVLTIDGDSYIAEGIADRWGGNIASTRNATITIGGNTVVDGVGSRCRSGWQLGNSIGVALGTVEVTGNAKVLHGKQDKNNPDNTALTTSFGIAVESGAQFKVGGACVISDEIMLRNKATTDSDTGVTTNTLATLTVNEGFTGSARVYWQLEDLRKEVVPGDALSTAAAATLNMANFSGEGAIYVLDNSSTGYPVAWTDSNKTQLQYAGFVAYKDSGVDDADGERIFTEVPLANLDNVQDGQYAYIKLNCNDGSGRDVTAPGKITLTSSTPIDMNNRVVEFTTGEYTLNAMDSRTDGGAVAGKTKFTVDNDANVPRFVTNPATGCQYVNVQAEDGSWTSNRIRVTLEKISIRPMTRAVDSEDNACGVYYTAKIKTNSNVSPYLVEYGVAATIDQDYAADGIPSGFYDKTAHPSIIYTAIGINTTGNVDKIVTSGMIDNIMTTENEKADNGLNKEQAEYPIYVDAYVSLKFGDSDDLVVIMSDQTASYSLRDVIVMLDEQYGKLNPAVAEEATMRTRIENFHDSYATTMASWYEADDENQFPGLPNFKAYAATKPAA